MAQPDGRIGHAEIKIGDSPIMLADEFPEMGFRSPQSLGGSPVSLYLYVDDVDALAKQAEAAGAKVVRPVKDQFYGDRSGSFEDPFGHQWHLATHVEDVAPEEIHKRAAAAGRS
jgi:PhnB protein